MFTTLREGCIPCTSSCAHKFTVALQLVSRDTCHHGNRCQVGGGEVNTALCHNPVQVTGN